MYQLCITDIWAALVSRGFFFLVYHKCSARGAFLGIFCFCRLLIILDSNWQQLWLSWIEIESKVLFVKTLLAKVKELKFACKVFPHYVFGCLKEGVVQVQNVFFLWLIKCFIFCDKTSSSYLRHRGFVYIPVYP